MAANFRASTRSREQLELLAMLILPRPERRVEVRVEDEVLPQVGDRRLRQKLYTSLYGIEGAP